MRGLRRRLNAAFIGVLVVGLSLGPASAYTTEGQSARTTQGVAERSDDPVDVAFTHVADHATDLGVGRADVNDMVVASSYRSGASGVTHVNLTQQFRGLKVFGAQATVNVAEDGKVLFVGDSLVKGLVADSPAAPDLGARNAVAAAADGLDLAEPDRLRVVSGPVGSAQKTVVSASGISAKPIPARLGWQSTTDGLRLAWQLVIDDASDAHLWNATVDAATGELLRADDWTSSHSRAELAATLDRAPVASARQPALVSPDPVDDGSSYRVFELPKESPNDGPRTLVANPADAVGSPFGWHDTDGASGAEFTTTQGNNVHAYTDRDANNTPDPGSDPSGGPGLDFDFPVDLNEHAYNYAPGSTTNLFYWNNVIHDVMYRYGFDEESGNFQANNYGRGGTAGDYVRAEAQDGNGDNNANFATPVETPTSGGTPRMQMFMWPGLQFGLPNAVTVSSGPAAGTYLGHFARFTPSPSTAGVSGDLVPASDGSGPPGDGCQPYSVPDGAIAIVDRTSTCNFYTQATNAQAAGAAALVVVNNTSANPVLMTGSMSPPIQIPATMISQADGNAIKAGLPATGSVHRNTDRPPMRDGDLDAGIVIHEYGHGVSTRLTGGPTVNCLDASEQAGEGWSDFFAITMLLDPAIDDPDQPRGLGPYALFQDDRHGAGIRPRPYSRDMSIQPFTYDSIKTGGWLDGTSLALPHGLGHGWASVLWDMTWDLIDKHGFNPDVYGEWDSGGNNRALQYVIEGLKFQGCEPGLVVARDAIIAAADNLSDGQDTCTLWASFARRGLGFSAVQGSSANRNDNTEAFDTHPDCQDGFFGSIEAEPQLNEVVSGSALPMVFSAGGDQGLDLLVEHSPYSRQVDCQTLRTVTPGAEFITPRPLPIPTETPDGAELSYDPEENRYTYPWKTEDTWGGTCREFVLTRDDGIQHRAYFQFRASPAFTVSGTIHDTDGQPIPNAEVTLDGSVLLRTRTDETGSYVIEDVPRGTYEAAASGGGCYEPASQQLDVTRSRAVDFTLATRADTFGNRCRLVNAPFEEADAALSLTGDDNATAIDLPFPFTFYGFTYTRARVCTNGFLEFIGPTTTNCTASNAAIPTTGRPNGAIYAYWDDWFVDDQASIRTQVKGMAPDRHFVIEFRNVQVFEDATRRVDFNIVLHENGEILTQYRNIANDERESGVEATIGIENHDGRDALRFSLNDAVLAPEPAVTSIRYVPRVLPAHTVSGQVRDADGEPIANATVTIEGTPITPATTDANGFYTFQRVPEDTYDVTAESGCSDPVTSELVLSGPSTLDFTLPPKTDDFGYTCSFETAGFDEADTVIPITGNDVAGTIDLPFPFTFYGFTHTRAYVCTNGFLEFVGPATTNCSSVNAAIPTTGRPNGQISPLWDDLFVDAESSIRTQTKGTAPDRRFVVEFRNVRFDETPSGRLDFNVVLLENGTILTQYRNVSDEDREMGGEATIGIENHTGTDALRVSLNEPILLREPAVTTIRYQAPPQAPSHPVSGHVRDADGDPIANATVTIEGTPITPATTDANGLYSFAAVPEGTYSVTAEAGCNSAVTSELVVSGPATLDFTLPARTDSFGYTCSFEATAFEEADTVVPITGDTGVGTIDLPFPFTFYGFSHTRAHVCANGFLEFVGPATTNCSSANAAIPTTGRPNGAIFPFWDNLSVDEQASIRTEVKGTAPDRRFVVEYRNVFFPPDTTMRIDFNIVLFENGEILTQYRNLSANVTEERGGEATIGIENHTGTDALRVSFNQASLPPEPAVTSIRYVPPPQAPSHQVSGQVRDADNEPVANATVTIEGTPITPATTDANGLYTFQRVPEGTYDATASGACDGDQTRDLVVAGDTTLDFSLPPRTDAFGHTCEVGTGTPFEEADTVLPITGDDVAGTVDLPFAFTFYGQTYSWAHVCTNGFVEFSGPTTTNCSASNAAIPTTGRPNGAVYAYWDDTFVDDQASIRTQVKGTSPDRRFVVEYRNLHYFQDTSRRVDFNIVLYENGEILTQYRNIADDRRETGGEATIGIESHAGNDALRVSFNESVLPPEPAVASIRYQPPAP